MSQSHGLGRGLSSLIPQKKSEDLENGIVSSAGGNTSRISPFGVGQSLVQPVAPAGTGIHPLKNIPVIEEDASATPATEVTASALTTKEIVSLPVSTSQDIGRGNSLSVPIGSVVPNPHQPRIQFSEEKLLELAQSIREHGILQPLIVTRVGDNFELIAGERRLQAAKIVGLAEVPVMVREAGNQEKFELAIVENIQRHDLNPIEESRAYERLSKEFQLSQEEIAKKMGRSRSAIANTMRLLQLPVEIQRAVIEETISEGHAKALLSIENPEKQRALFELIVHQGLTVRETETKSREVSIKPPRKMVSKDPELEAREQALSEIFGTKVRIAKTGIGGMIRIDYFSDEEFKNIFSKLAGEKGEVQHY